MHSNSDLPGGKQATKGDKQLTVIYYMDDYPLSNIRQLNEMGVVDSLYLLNKSSSLTYILKMHKIHCME
jgi:hypothetical protein